MTPMKPTPEELEKLVRAALRDLPDRRAPVTLEARVLAEIGRRSELPWWRRSYIHWPVAVRVGFFILSAAIAAVAIAGLFTLMRSAGAADLAGIVGRLFAWMEPLRAAGKGTFQAMSDIFHAVPNWVVYGALTTIAAFYAAIVGIGATAYHAFTGRG